MNRWQRREAIEDIRTALGAIIHADPKKRPTLDMFMATPVFESAMKKAKGKPGIHQVSQEEFVRLVSSWAKHKC